MSDVAKINIELDSSSSNRIKRYTDGGTSNSFDGKYQLTEIDMDEMEKLKSDLEDMSILELVGDNISNVFSDIGDAFSDTNESHNCNLTSRRSFKIRRINC